jgi:hypothetical protein
LVGAVVLVVGLALRACQVGPDLSANTSAVSNLEVLDLRTDLDDLANDLVADAERERDVFAPAAGNCVDVRGADTASVNGDVYIMVFELLEGQLSPISDIPAAWFEQLHTSLRVKLLQFLISVTAKASVVSG